MQVVAEEVTVFNPLRDPDAYAAQTRQTMYGYSLMLYYWDEGGNVLTAASLAKIKEIEDHIYNTAGCPRRMHEGQCRHLPAAAEHLAVGVPDRAPELPHQGGQLGQWDDAGDG